MINNLLQVAGAILAALLFAYAIAHICYWSKHLTPGFAQLATAIVWCGITYYQFHVINNVLLYSCICFAAVSMSLSFTVSINDGNKK